MSLSEDVLFNGLKDLPQSSDPPPIGDVKAAENLAKVFEEYYKDGLATPASVTLSYLPLQPLLLNAIASKTLMQTLGSNIQLWALSWIWDGGGMTGTPGSTVALGPVLDTALTAFVLKAMNDKSDPPKDKENLEELANIIHTWSKTILVNLVNSAGTTVPTTIT